MLHEIPSPNWSLATLEVGTKDLGWAAGTLLDDREYHLERWSESGSDLVTIYFSPEKLEIGNNAMVLDLLLRANLLLFKNDTPEIDIGLVKDSLGQDMLSINILLSDSSGEYAVLLVNLEPYSN